MTRPRIVSWFSCGTASAVATKLVVAAYWDTHDIAVARCVVPEEHPDNDRFAAECATWFGRPVISLSSAEYASCHDVWTRRRFMAGPHGAVCTIEMKKAVRWAFEREWKPDLQAFGYTADETDRAERFRDQNPDVRLITPLIEQGLSKQDCHAIVDRAGIELPAMYRLGFNNANCFSGDTEFLTDVGVRRLRDMVDKPTRVRGVGGGWTSAMIRSFGVQSLMRLILQRNNVRREIYATANHRWFVKPNGHGPILKRTTEGLLGGQRLTYVLGRLGARVRPSAFGIAQGIVFGDGSRQTKLNAAATIVLCGDKNAELLRYFPLSPSMPAEAGIEVKDLPRFWKDLPRIDDCQSFLYGWLAGYFSADGCVSNGEYLLASARREHLEFARDLSVRLGIGTNDIRETSRQGFPGRDHSNLYVLPLIGSTLRADFFLLSEHRSRFLASPPRDPHPWTVVSVEATDRIEEVFCAVVPDGKAFTLSGNILTGNCIGCVQAQSPSYWNRVRRYFPAVFEARAVLSRELGVRLVKGTAGERERIFLDELDPDMGAGEVDPAMDCSLLCYIAEQKIGAAP